MIVEARADYSLPRQILEGFGASNAWTQLPHEQENRIQLVKMLFSRTEGIGLNILRTRVPFRENHIGPADRFIMTEPDGSYTVREENGIKYFSFNWNAWEVSHTRSLLREIAALGDDGPEDLVLMATPWTPPNQWKTGYADPEKPAYGGTLKHEHYPDYADILIDFANQYKENMGRRLDVLSMQNEPDYVPDYESCRWNSTEIMDFLKILGSRIEKKGTEEYLRFMAPESMHLSALMVYPTLNDPDARKVLGVFGAHQYNHKNEFNMGAAELPAVKEHGIPVWLTEVSSGETNDPSIKDGIYWARLIHLDMTITEVNAFLYWWLWSTDSNTKGCLIDIQEGEILDNKRLYTMGQFSRFIRPGWQRIEADKRPVMGLHTSMYRNPDSDEIVLVIVSERNSTVELNMTVDGISGFRELSTWRTSETENLAPVKGPRHKDSTIHVTVPAFSVSTVYGRVE